MLRERMKKRFLDAKVSMYQNIITLLVTIFLMPLVKWGLSQILRINLLTDGLTGIITVFVSSLIAFILAVFWDYLREQFFGKGEISLEFQNIDTSASIFEHVYDLGRMGMPMDKVLLCVKYTLTGDLVFWIFKKLHLGISVFFDPKLIKLDIDGEKADAVEVASDQERIFIPLVANEETHNKKTQSISDLELCFTPVKIPRDYTELIARIEIPNKKRKFVNWIFDKLLADIVIGENRNFKIIFQKNIKKENKN